MSEKTIDWLRALAQTADHLATLLEHGPAGPPVSSAAREGYTQNCLACREDKPVTEFPYNRTICPTCKPHFRQCSLCDAVKSVLEFSGADHRCKPCNAERNSIDRAE